MPISENEAIEISVLSGQTAQASVFLHQGKTTNPASVGTAGEWTIVADGVAPVHVFFAFDGNDVFVAAAPGVAAVLAGTLLGTQWSKASIPCELRFAGACLVMRKIPKDRAGSQPDGFLASTVGDGGALLKAAQRAVEVAMRAQQGRPPSFESTAVMPGGARLVLPSPADVSPPSTLRMSNRPLSPLGEKAEGSVLPLGAPGAGKAALAAASGEAPEAKKDGELKAYWKTASPVKRASLVLMPFAMALSYWMLQPAPPPPPPKLIASAATAHPTPSSSAATAGSAASRSPASSASATAPAASAAPSASAVASSAPVVPAAPPVPAVPAASTAAKAVKPTYAAKLPPGKRTPDREAIDAVASGAFDDAEKRYDSLASAHPDIVAYKEAARVLADKSGHAR